MNTLQRGIRTFHLSFLLRVSIALLIGVMFGTGNAFAATCESLIAQSSPGTTITSVVSVPGPTYTAPDGITYDNVPAFCKVSATLTPTADSLINVELWMPSNTWNNKFQGIGNGGYAGTIALGAPAMVTGLRNGFAVATTDMGTAPSTNNDADALVGHPQKWIDFGYRATHLMTTFSKQIMQAFYSQAPRYSYFNGCSTGGQQALMEAQRFPTDYDGILAGSAAHNRTHIHTTAVWNFKAMHNSVGGVFTPESIQLITNSVLAACAVKSGGLSTDPFLTDPRACDWDPSALQCASATSINCLNADQVAAARAIYGGPRNPVTGNLIYPGGVKGCETDPQFGWASIQTNPEPPFDSLFKWVFGSTWLWPTFDYNNDMASVDSLLASNLNANSSDLSQFQQHGGKLIMYHGWADPLAPPQESINYYLRVVASQGNNGSAAAKQTQTFYRLFMVPGMYHCATGPGPNAFGNQFSGMAVTAPPLSDDAGHNIFTALQQWVENGIAPDRVVAAKYVQDQPGLGVQMTRPICVFPKVPHYNGNGDTADAANFTCVDNGVTNNQAAASVYEQ